MYALLRIVTNMLPLVYVALYRASRRFGSKISSIAIARNVSIEFLFVLSLITMAFVGTHRGCRKLVSVGTNGQKASTAVAFVFYFVKSMALPSTYSFAMTIFTSPGVAMWKNRIPFMQYLLMPTLWPSPFLMQILHQSFGVNFLFCGFTHGVVWVGIFSSGIIEFCNGGTIFAALSGIIMLCIGVKMVWPPGLPLPFKVTGYLLRIETFLKDSKYGSYHVFLGFSLLVLYCLHASFILSYSYSPYFLFSLVAYGILRFIHPSFVFFHPSKTVFKFVENFEILSVKSFQLRQHGVHVVKILMRPPVSHDPSMYRKTSCDIITLRNTQSIAQRVLETVHYFSVVSIKLVEDSPASSSDSYLEVTLLISPTRRPDGISQALVTTQSAAAKLKFDMYIFLKSNGLESLYTPSLIAVAFDSGAAAFCSLLKERVKMRAHINSLSKMPAKMNALHDLYIIWLAFKPPSKKQTTTSDIVSAVEGLVRFQEFLYQSSGGDGVKIIFIASGVPPEWTPSPECISHKTTGILMHVYSYKT